MKAASINSERLTELCNEIRQFSGLTPKEKREFLSALLVEAGVLKEADVSQLVCFPCAKKMRGYVSDGTLYRMATGGRLIVYRLCHKDFLDKDEIAAMPPLREVQKSRREWRGIQD